LRVFQNLHLLFHAPVAKDVFRVLTPAGQMSRLHAAPLSTDFCARRQNSGKKYCAWETRWSLAVKKKERRSA